MRAIAHARLSSTAWTTRLRVERRFRLAIRDRRGWLANSSSPEDHLDRPRAPALPTRSKPRPELRSVELFRPSPEDLACYPSCRVTRGSPPAPSDPAVVSC